MNEHHTPAGNSVYPANVSPGGNSPVMGRGPDRDRFGAMGARHDLPPRAPDHLHGAPRSREAAIRPRDHHFASDSRGALERHQTNPLPILALGLGGGLMLGLLFTARGTAKHRGHDWRTESWTKPSYSPQHSYREDAAYRAGESSRVATDETRDLIASDKVEGTAVYDRNGEHLGSVYNFMVGKRSGQVAYAVMSFGGWLGMGESYHPLPWHTLTYDTARGGYVVSLTKERLRNAPSHKVDADTASDAAYWRRVKDYWA
jgi:PRC-barrel domain